MTSAVVGGSSGLDRDGMLGLGLGGGVTSGPEHCIPVLLIRLLIAASESAVAAAAEV